MKFCFPGENYGKAEKSIRREQQSGFDHDKAVDKSISKPSSSSFIENETINKGSSFNKPTFKHFEASQGLKSETAASLELFSSGTQVLVRFRSSDGRFPSKGFRAKYKTGKIILIYWLLYII